VVSRYLCLRPDDGSNTVWFVVKADDGRVDATFLYDPKTSRREIKLHNNVGTGYWVSGSFDLIASKWQEFKEINK
jgi:hypothetical protein